MAHATTHVRRIYLVRHAIAEARGPAWPRDGERPLTTEGIRRMRGVVRGLAALGVAMDVVLTSPLVRARQTADILVRDLPVPLAPINLVELAPGRTPFDVARAVARRTDAGALALVGHEPGLGELAAWLLGTAEPLAFRKGGVCCLDVPAWPPAPSSRLVWMATPKMLRALRRP